jgi:hypothetical protein
MKSFRSSNRDWCKFQLRIAQKRKPLAPPMDLHPNPSQWRIEHRLILHQPRPRARIVNFVSGAAASTAQAHPRQAPARRLAAAATRDAVMMAVAATTAVCNLVTKDKLDS